MDVDREEISRSNRGFSMNILYVAPDIPVPHTGDFIGGSTYVLKIAESLAKRGNNIFIISNILGMSCGKDL